VPSRVLVTGMTGFAGRYLVANLTEAGHEVLGLTGHHPGAATPSEAPSVDLRDLGAVQAAIRDLAPDRVVHLAAISFVGHNDVAEIYDTNIVGTRNLLTALAELPKRPEAVLLTSSANVYGNADVGVLDEDQPPAPVNDYAVSKIAMEYMARQFSEILPIVISRPFNYTGRGQAESFLVPKIVKHFKQRADHIELGNLDVSRDFSDVRTVVQYMRRLVETPAAASGVYNICSGRPYSLQYILDACARISGHQLEVRINPAFVRANEVKVLTGDPSRLHRAVGAQPDFRLEDTLAWMLAD
jgi:nucleoside-diphosphate-sugar epimerase